MPVLSAWLEAKEAYDEAERLSNAEWVREFADKKGWRAFRGIRLKIMRDAGLYRPLDVEFAGWRKRAQQITGDSSVPADAVVECSDGVSRTIKEMRKATLRTKVKEACARLRGVDGD